MPLHTPAIRATLTAWLIVVLIVRASARRDPPSPSAPSSSPTLTHLPLCDCRPAADDPAGLLCTREGDVLAGFEHEGQWVAGGGGVVPLSRAICCRVCLPEEEEGGGDGRGDGGDGGVGEDDNNPPIAVVSVNCRPPPPDGTAGGAMSCASASAGGMVVGWSSSAPVPAIGPEVAFPLGAPSCCSPALLRRDGSLVGTTPCDCGPAPRGGVSCANGSDAALRGFAGFRVSLGGDVVPAGAGECCRTCVDLSGGGRAGGGDCGGPGGCGRHGTCARGGCVCAAGWGGPTCALRTDGGAGLDFLEALLAVAGVLALLLAGAAVGRGVAASVRELVAAATASASGDGGPPAGASDDALEPLIIRLAGGVGSVGSVDTDGDDDDEEDDGAGGSEAGSEAGATTRAGEEGATPRRSPPDAGAPPAASTTPDAAVVTKDGEADEPSASAAASVPGLPPGVGACVVCTARPIQAVAVPCGHACLCRRCARRLARCPVCRCELVRRQRLYVGG